MKVLIVSKENVIQFKPRIWQIFTAPRIILVRDMKTTLWAIFDQCLKLQIPMFEHELWMAREEIAFTTRVKIHSRSQIFRYGRSIFRLPHRPNCGFECGILNSDLKWSLLHILPEKIKIIQYINHKLIAYVSSICL